MPELSIGSRVRKSAFYDATVAAGANVFTIYNHMYMPLSYGYPAAEYQRLTESVALWDVASERQVEIVGPDATTFVQYLSARDLSGCEVGRARYAPLCNHAGHLINDPVILRVGDDRYWLSIADSDILLWAQAVAGERGVDVAVFEPDVSPLAIQGPRAAAVARELFGGAVVDLLGFFHHTPAEVEGIPLVLCRSGWSKQGGYELFLTDSAGGGRLWDLVMAAGHPYGIGPGAPNHAERMESGLLSYASDTGVGIDPFEAGLGEFTSLDASHDFVGKRALRQRLMSGNRRTLVNVWLQGDVTECQHPWPVTVDRVPAGEVRNAVRSPRLGGWIGIALLTEESSGPGTELDVQTPSGRITATVALEPFGQIR